MVIQNLLWLRFLLISKVKDILFLSQPGVHLRLMTTDRCLPKDKGEATITEAKNHSMKWELAEVEAEVAATVTSPKDHTPEETTTRAQSLFKDTMTMTLHQSIQKIT
jgi:hypothetical protein